MTWRIARIVPLPGNGRSRDADNDPRQIASPIDALAAEVSETLSGTSGAASNAAPLAHQRHDTRGHRGYVTGELDRRRLAGISHQVGN